MTGTLKIFLRFYRDPTKPKWQNISYQLFPTHATSTQLPQLSDNPLEIVRVNTTLHLPGPVATRLLEVRIVRRLDELGFLLLGIDVHTHSIGGKYLPFAGLQK